MDKILKSIIVMQFFVVVNLEAKTQTDSVKVVNLQEVIVKGDAKTDPTLSIVKADYTSKATQPKNSGELFSDINGFSLIKRGNYAVDPSFRASQYEQLNIQFDGGTKAMHACPNRMDPITTLVNPEEVTRIEIIKGPFTVRYGSSFAGTINLVTNSSATNTKKIAGTVSTGYESNGNAMVNNVLLKSKLNKFDFTANANHKQYGNYSAGDGSVIPSSFTSNGYGVKVGYVIQENQRLQIGFRQNYGRDILHAGLPMDTKKDDSSIADIDYNLLINSKYLKSITAKAYYSFVDHIMDNSGRNTFAATEAVAKVNAGTAGAKTELKWDMGNKMKLFTGLDYTSLARKGNRERIVKKNMAGQLLPTPQKFTDKVWQNSQLDQAGIFAEGKYIASENDFFTYGARVDFVRANATDLDVKFATLYPDLSKKSEVNFSGTATYQRKISENSLLEIAYGRGVRTANIEERYMAFFNIGRDAYEYIGNPNLKPEINNQFELSLKGSIDFGGFFGRFTYGTSVYYSFLDNYIMGVVDSSLVRKYSPTIQPIHPKVFRNISQAMKTGVEANGTLNFAAHFKFSTDISYVYTENEVTKESLPLTPPFMARLKLEYEQKMFWLNLRLTIAGQQNRISTAFDELASPGYEVFDFEAGIIPVKNLKIGIAALNFLNKHYVNHLSFAFNNVTGFGRVPIPEAGRNLTVFASYSF